ncbi:hypothetical protein Tco_0173248 [Tanacetum coccineum]
MSHFKNRFDHPQDSRIQLDLSFPNTPQPDQIIDLECDVLKDEIERAVWDRDTDKSPGPDGFTFGSNSSFIALILKTRDGNMVKDFRPISLIGSMYKIIAKILVNRIVLVLGDLVNEVQSAFITDSLASLSVREPRGAEEWSMKDQLILLKAMVEVVFVSAAMLVVSCLGWFMSDFLARMVEKTV